MGKFMVTKFSDHQLRVVKKRPGKSIKRCTSRKPPQSKKSRKVPLPAKTEIPKKLEEVDDPNLEYQDLRTEVGTNPDSGRHYLKLVQPISDLFADDELKARYYQYTKHNLIFIIFDEISLEGLDGITIEALWKRIEHTLMVENMLDGLKEVIWQIVCLNEQIRFFELPDPRPELVIYNKDSHVSQQGPDIYKVAHPARNSAQWGSCSVINTRVDISEKVRKISLDEAIVTYGNKLVLVATDELRKNALLGDLMDPNYDFTEIEYCLLEKIGRARELGEITLGPMALSTSVGLDPKSIYHYCKRLKKEYLVARQYCSISIMEHTKIGRLLHLRRFYRKEKSKYMILMETIINYLKKCPGYRAPYPSVRSLLNMKASSKFFKHHDFLTFVDTNIYVPFKEYYTEATFEEYMTKSMTSERVVQLMQLKDPYINLVACWGDTQNIDSSDDEDEDGDTNSKGRRIYNKDIIRDVYQHIVSKGLGGISATDLLGVFDVDFPTLRCILKKLVLRKLVNAKKFDVGRQTVNQYVAVCLLEHQDIKISPASVGMGSSTAIEKLKQRQKRKIDSLPKERIYSLEQLETDLEDQLLSLDTPVLRQITFQIPQIACQYIISVASAPESLQEIMDIFSVKFIETLEPFKINLTFPVIADDNSPLKLRKMSVNAIENQQIALREYIGEFCVTNFKPDNISQAFLMKALLDKVKMNKKEIIDFLDGNKTKLAEKRSKVPEEKVPKKMKLEDDVSVPVGGLGVHLGSNPILVLMENDETTGFHTEIYMSTPLEEYKTGDITEYVSNPTVVVTERVASRTAFVLKIVQEQRIVDEMHAFLKLIYQEEKATGYDKRIDRKSLHRIFKTLTNEGCLRIYSIKLVKGNTKKQQTYVCHPDITFDHPVLQEKLYQVKEKAYCYINKKEDELIESVPETPKVAERSPFVEDDVLRSINEIKELTSLPLKAKSSKKSGKFYGHRPKFARLALIHELLFYLVYELNINTQPLSKGEVANLFSNHQIKLTEADLKNLPPVYCREISWKTFIPPLPNHMGWGEGWALLVDVILRFPITLITRTYAVNFVSRELQDILLHPIKRFYLLKNVSSNIRTIVMYKRKFIHDMYNHLVLLAYCGLCQFGPASYHDKEKSFFYLNRRATLWDTTSSTPGYQKIENKDYPKLSFYFDKIEDVLKYWSTMNNICIHTNLSTKLAVAGKTITLVHSTAKPSLNKVRTIRTQNEAQQYDTGELPGDHEGAAGLDCSMWSHIQRSWYFFATKKEPCFTESLDTLKLGEVENNRVAFDRLKLHATTSNKYYIPKPQQLKVITRKAMGPAIGKTNSVIKRTVPIIKRKPPSEIKMGLDPVDKAVLRKCSSVRYRPIWTEEEDKLLILLKIASAFITPGTNKQVISYATLRDVLHIFEPRARDKTSRSLSNRLKIINRSVTILSNIESLIPNLYKLVPIAKYFVPFRKFVLYGTDKLGFNRKFKLSDPELHNAFIFLAHYFMTHRKEVEVSLHGRNTSTDYFNSENLAFFKDSIEPFEKKVRFYSEPECEADIRKSALKNTIQSALSHKNDKTAWSIQTYKIYQQFSEDVLREVLLEMKSQRMIQFNKHTGRTFFTPYRLSVHYVFSQSTTFWFNTMEDAYKTFLDLKYSPSELNYCYDEEKSYGQMFATNELLSFMPNDVTIDFKIPEYHLILNPEVKDHSDVIDELANRYQAKLKNEQKGAELQTELKTSSKMDEDEAEIPEPVPGPSTAEPEEPRVEVISFDDDELLDLSITAKNSTTIDNLKHWISDCIDTERVRSPSPELLNLEVSQGPEQGEAAEVESSTPMQEEGRLLTLEEIKEEMLKRYDDKEKPVVPYISDLTRLLNENFEDIEKDDRAYYLMKKHFVQQYPSVEKIQINGLHNHYLSEFFENRSSVKDVWVRVEKEAFIGTPSDNGVAFDDILDQGGSIEDVTLAYELLQFIESKMIYGAPGYEIKEKFSSYENTCSLELLLKILTKHNIVIRTGVCSIRFVYHKHLNPWLTDTFTLTAEQVSAIPDTAKSGEDLQKLEDDIKGINITKWIKIKALPWAMPDGILDKDMLKMWLSHVFSYCIENPKISFNALCDKFCFLKPVDIFYLLEILEEVGAVELRRLAINNVDCFSDYEFPKDYKATALDRFEEIYIDLNNVGFTTLGSFFQNL